MKVVSVGSRSFAATMVALGILGFVYGDFAMVWQEVPNWVPGRELLAYLCAAIMLLCGVGLMLPRTARLASGVLLLYLVLWLLLLRVPKVLAAPGVVVAWSGCGDTAIYVAAGWVLFGGIRGARLLYGLALIPCGLAHFAYAKETAEFIPEAWIPW